MNANVRGYANVFTLVKRRRWAPLCVSASGEAGGGVGAGQEGEDQGLTSMEA